MILSAPRVRSCSCRWWAVVFVLMATVVWKILRVSPMVSFSFSSLPLYHHDNHSLIHRHKNETKKQTQTIVSNMKLEQLWLRLKELEEENSEETGTRTTAEATIKTNHYQPFQIHKIPSLVLLQRQLRQHRMLDWEDEEWEDEDWPNNSHNGSGNGNGNGDGNGNKYQNGYKNGNNNDDDRDKTDSESTACSEFQFQGDKLDDCHPSAHPNTQVPTTAPLSSVSTVEPTSLPNGIRVSISIAVVHLEHLTKQQSTTLVTMCLRTITILINRNLPFHVWDYIPTLRQHYYHHHHGGGGGGRRHLRTLHEDDQDKDDDHRLVAKLILNNVQIQESPTVPDWYVLYVDYAVYWPNDQPVLSTSALQETNQACDDVLQQATATNNASEFWHTLHELPFGQDLLLPRASESFYVDQAPYMYQNEDKGLADVVSVGQEYDFSYMVTSTENDGFESFGGGENDTEMIGSTNVFDNDPYNSDSNNNKTMDDATYPYVMTASDIEWKTREWIGFGMMVGTIMIVVTLWGAAWAVQERKRRRQEWGIAVFTEEGVGELLRVGWRYTQQDFSANHDYSNNNINNNSNNHRQQQIQHQLFLQVFDKGRIGYNDDNSMLQGGVVERYNNNDVGDNVGDHWGRAEQAQTQPFDSTDTPTTSASP
mmetsp:Transcript_5457/g.9537  ORF Transcript_5457/g.9537 Transcript_5457/m.9537 type:complete len:650 (-) Transcript_5457:929-2878(-)